MSRRRPCGVPADISPRSARFAALSCGRFAAKRCKRFDAVLPMPRSRSESVICGIGSKSVYSSATALLHRARDVSLARRVLTSIEREALLAVAFKLLLEVVDGREALALHELAV